MILSACAAELSTAVVEVAVFPYMKFGWSPVTVDDAVAIEREPYCAEAPFALSANSMFPLPTMELVEPFGLYCTVVVPVPYPASQKKTAFESDATIPSPSIVAFITFPVESALAGIVAVSSVVDAVEPAREIGELDADIEPFAELHERVPEPLFISAFPLEP